MKRRLIAMLALLSAVMTASAQEATPSDTETATVMAELSATPAKPKLEIGVQTWLSRGSGEFEIEFGGVLLNARSKLTWEDIDAPIFILHAEAEVAPRIRVGGLIGLGSIDDGKNTDEDWLWDAKFSESQSDTDGDVVLGDINVYYRLTTPGPKEPIQMDGFLGYSYYKDDLNITNGKQIVPDNGPFPGLDSTYSFEWQMARIGVRLQTDVADKFTLRGNAAVLYLLRYKGEGFWNLREDFRQKDPNFIQTSHDGMGYEGKFSGTYHYSESLHFEAGYWVLYMEADDGEDVTYLADGRNASTDLTHVETLRHGLFASINVLF